MLAGVALVAVGVALFHFAEDVVHARRFGSVTDSARSADTGGAAFRVAGLLLVAVGVTELVGGLLA